MGNKISLKNKLKFPAWCVLDKLQTGDVKNCLESWIYCVRHRENDKEISTFQQIKHTFFDNLKSWDFTLDEMNETNFLICLLSMLVHRKYIKKIEIEKILKYKIPLDKWDDIGRSLIITLKQYYKPREWTPELQKSWIRLYSDYLHQIFKK